MNELQSNSIALFAATREKALARLAEFSRTASRYSRDRNYVVPNHTNVSRLSPAIRHRLVSEQEAAQVVLGRYAFSTVEKFLQEIYWRRYWKSWLSMRPQIWSEYLIDLEAFKNSEQIAQAEIIMKGQGSITIMNDFACELVETGYLHNHARMWFAAYWVHTLRLPWQLGADFFYRNLLDADPASNTLSWRWVAGIQTPGKTYIARRSNIEKYLHPNLLIGREEGLELLESSSALVSNAVRISLEKVVREVGVIGEGKTGFWIHEEDLSIDEIVKEIEIDQVLITGNEGLWEEQSFSDVKKNWMRIALDDTAKRMNKELPDKVSLLMTRSLSESLCNWADEHKLDQVLAYRPEVGFIDSQIQVIRNTLSGIGVNLVLLDHQEDEDIREFAKSGFFSFWKKVEPFVRSLKVRE